MGEEMGSNVVTVGMQTDEQLWRREEPREEPRATKKVSASIEIKLWDEDGDLLPGLPNDITLDQIVTKLPWTAFHVLSSVSHCWHQAIRSHKIHDARVRSHATDELVVMKYSEDNFLTLYSMTDEHYYKLPCIARINERARTPTPVSCVSLNGKIYVLGGEYENSLSTGCRKVYVRDLAGQREWRRCANMKHRRDKFGYGAKDGKIYVFGGFLRDRSPCRCEVYEPEQNYWAGRTFRGCEVYDPEQNSWSQIAHMESYRYAHQVASLGDELFVFNGYFYGPCEVGWTHSPALVLEAYHPTKNKWRRVGEHPDGRVFMALGKFHLMTENAIDVYDHEKNTWSHLHSITYDCIFHDFSLPYDIVASNDKLLLESDGDGDDDYRLFQGEGLGDKNREILFGLKASGSSEEVTFPCTIQL